MLYLQIIRLTQNLAEEVLQACFDKFGPGVEEFSITFTNNPLTEETEGDNLLGLLGQLGSVYDLIKSVPSAQTKKEKGPGKRKSVSSFQRYGSS